MNQQTLTVKGIPIPQSRPRFYRRGNRVGTYYPDKCNKWKRDIILQVKTQQPELYTKAISIDIQFVMPRPKYLPKKVIHHTKKPDLDNLTIIVLNALNKICFNDDSQIINLSASKEYTIYEARIIIRIMEIL